MTLFTTLCLLCCAESLTDALQAICTAAPITVEEGRDVSLPCHVEPAVDLSPYTVDWKRTDTNTVVFSYRHKREHHDAQTARYRNRTAVEPRDLSRGNLTLRLLSVQPADSGPYRCFIPKWNTLCAVQLNVTRKTERHDSTTRSPPDTTVEPANPGGIHTVLIVAAVLAAVLATGLGFLLISFGVQKSCEELQVHKYTVCHDSTAKGRTREAVHTSQV